MIPWAMVVPAVMQIFDKVIPDPQAAADAKLKALAMAQNGELAELSTMKELALAQAEINRAEASSGDIFRAGWRPMIGYVLATALAFAYVINPMIIWAAAIWAPDVAPPNIGMDEHLWEIMFGMLGLGGLRTFERVKGKG